MANIKINLGSLALVQEESGRQVIEWEVARGLKLDLAHLINLAQGRTSSESNSQKELAQYIEKSLNNLGLPTICYQQSTYFGLRSEKDDRTMVYWNENSKEGYCNINVKTFLLDPILIKMSFINDHNGYDDDGITCYKWTKFNGFIFTGSIIRLNQEIRKLIESIADEYVSECLLKYYDDISKMSFFTGTYQLTLNRDWWVEYEKRIEYVKDYTKEYPYGHKMFQPLTKEDLQKDIPGPYLQIEPILNEMRQERLIVDVDQDSRFSNTKRIRLYTKNEIDVFIERLAPQIENYLRECLR
ncbi:hypothetical protein IQ225_02430 [Synechocystis salina LEGE 06155]|nr:hypothetical protein [Synechocystis salina LEGE 06155]